MSNLKDYATSTVLTAPSPADSGTSLVVQSGHGARFPAAPFYVTVHPPSEFPTLDNAEKLLVSSKSTDTFTITRGEGDTIPLEIEAGWRISNSVFLSDLQDDENVEAAGAVMETDTSTADMDFVLDEDNMASDSATKLATQQSIKAYVDDAISDAKQALLPVGSIVVLGVSTNPNTLYGFGTWAAIAGKVLVGYDSGQTEFDTLDETGGAKTVTLTAAESGLPAHTHTASQTSHRHSNGNHGTSGGGYGHLDSGTAVSSGTFYTDYQAPAITVNNNSAAAASSAHNNLQPYIVKYMWQRTA